MEKASLGNKQYHEISYDTMSSHIWSIKAGAGAMVYILGGKPPYI
jgi:hypothetical protein